MVRLLAIQSHSYCVTEYNIGWIVTYLIDTRGGGPSTGYVSSGLYGGEVEGEDYFRTLTDADCP